MTLDQTVVWVLLPNGATGDAQSLRASLFVAPRLRGDEGETLAPFADFLDWPARLRDAATELRVALPDGTTVVAEAEKPLPDSTLWTRFFTPETRLRPFVFDDYADRPFVTYGAAAIASALRDAYARTAVAAPYRLPPLLGDPRREPPVRGLSDLFGDVLGLLRGALFEGVRDGDDLDARIAALLARAREQAATRRAAPGERGGTLIEPLEANGTVAGELARALVFHRRPHPRTPVEIPSDDAAVARYADLLDFHRLLGALGDHPVLLRRLGLVVDVVLPRGQIPTTAPGDTLSLRIAPTWASALGVRSHDVTPATRSVHLQADGVVTFTAAPRAGGGRLDGLVDLPAAAFDLAELDLDGAALKAIGLAATLARAQERAGAGDVPLGAPESAGLPALRTAGLSLVQTGRADDLQSAFARQLAVNGGLDGAAPVELDADDLRRGVRVDVRDSAGDEWRTLHARTIEYAVEGLDPPLPPATDEGTFELSLASPPTESGQGATNDEIYVHERVVTWDGWSLSVPRPGKSLARDPRAPDPAAPETQPARVANDALTSLGVSITSSPVPASLPRLRFGHRYQVRLRSVDLAGNGPDLAVADQAGADPSAIPADRPRPYRRFEPVAAPAIVPRDRFAEGSSLLRLVVRSDTGRTPDDWAATTNASDLVTSGRHRPYQAADERHVVAPKASLQQVELHGLLDDVVGLPAPPPPGRAAAIAAAYDLARRESGSLDDPTVPGVDVVEIDAPGPDRQRYVIHPEADVALPYLPDPLAAGAVFFDVPGSAGDAPVVVTYDRTSWYDPAPFRLRLVGGSAAPAYDPVAHVLTLAIPQAERASVRVASLFDGDLRAMGIIGWCEEALSPDDLDVVVTAAKQNRCWLLTPWHELELVHAVARPLAAPTIEALEITRPYAATFAHIFGLVGVDEPSTDKIELLAAWSEPVDDPASGPPGDRASDAVVLELPLRIAATDTTAPDPRAVPVSLVDHKLASFSSAAAVERNAPFPPPHHFGDTKHRDVRYSVRAATAFREFFPAEWATDPDRLSLTTAFGAVTIPSSAPPAAPLVDYVIPTLARATVTEGATTTMRRTGGLRVYLRRPWYSSGDGELLGVVVGPNLSSPTQPEYPFISLIGADPVRGGATPEFLTTDRFRGQIGVADRTALLEVPGLYSIVDFDVAYDAASDRWFADLEIDTARTYFPLVRLALVRHQPASLPGCAVSPVVLTHIVSPLPDRTLTVVRDPAGQRVDITLAGPAYSSIKGTGDPRSDPPALARVVARLEERASDTADDLVAWAPLAGSEIELTPNVAPDTGTWRGTLQLQAPGGRPRRVVVVEFDRLSDAATPDRTIERIVYAETVGLG